MSAEFYACMGSGCDGDDVWTIRLYLWTFSGIRLPSSSLDMPSLNYSFGLLLDGGGWRMP